MWDGRVDGGLAEPIVWVDEWADWAAADGDGGDNDGAVGAHVPFVRMSAAEFIKGVVPRVAHPIRSPCARGCGRSTR